MWMPIQPSKSLGEGTSFTHRWAAHFGDIKEFFDASSKATAGTELKWLLRLPQHMVLPRLNRLFQLIHVANSLALVLLCGLLQIQLQTLFSCHSWNCS